MGFKYIFTVLKSERKSPTPPDSELKKIPGFMFCKFLGANRYTIMSANEFNRYYNEIPIENQYKLIKQVFGGKNIFIKMPKKSKEDDSLDNLCRYYKISRERAKEYLQYIDQEELNKINEMYKSLEEKHIQKY